MLIVGICWLQTWKDMALCFGYKRKLVLTASKSLSANLNLPRAMLADARL